VGGTAQFVAAASDTGAAAFTFTWFRDGVTITPGGRFTVTPGVGGRSSTLAISGVQASDGGGYTCSAANTCFTAVSGVAALAINAAAPVSVQGAQATTCRWGSQTYTATPGGSGSYTYRWQIADDAGRTNWHDLADGALTVAGVANQGLVAGSGSASMTLSGLAPFGSSVASFRVNATGPCGMATSGVLNLSVCAADFNCSGSIEIADIFAFLNAWLAGDPHTDCNGIPGLQVQDIFTFFTLWFNGCS
jgi:hypothetical protein